MKKKQNDIFYRTKKLISKIKQVSKEKGICYVICAGIHSVRDSFSCYYYRVLKSRSFTFEGHTYGYFYHKYHRTWGNERAVEIPVARKIVEKYRADRILEVGNVLSHYFHVNHDIVDKYEKADGVINQDVVDFRPPKKYDLIVSISTLEHVGVDEGEELASREPTKILRAIENLKTLLASRGKIVITLPSGYTPELDKLLKEGKIQFTKRYCLKRISIDNKWVETDWNDIQNAKYDSPFPRANGLIIGIIEK